MTKSEIRKIYRLKRMELAAAQTEKFRDLMLIRFQGLHLDIPDTVMTFAPMEQYNEYDPILVEDYCFFKNPGVQFLYPVMHPKTLELTAHAIKEDTLFESNEFGIDEPINGTETDPRAAGMILIPLLAFNEQGFRVGYGKGYYDRFLKQCRPDALRIGFSYFPPAEVNDFHDADEKLHICITPDAVYEF